ncbi:XK-related protein 9 isoform X1 [Osmerus mordax]|uniref:XK-related protein 9 isoform X1 n=1 Tax=Osmerus mordax TaxID=8014 RepID=UPI00350FFBBB
MISSESQYTKLRWICTALGLVLYLVDVGTDIVLGVTYFIARDFVWSGLTLFFMLLGAVSTQIFSYAWYRDDMRNVLINPDGNSRISGMSKCGLTLLHLSGMGVFTRYYHLLKKGGRAVWSDKMDEKDQRLRLFCLATDLSMLKLFETFLESAPQLLLQLYIILGHNYRSITQYVSLVGSFVNITWSIVDYRRCLRRSLTHVNEMPSGLPLTVYMLYKLLTITSHILSYTLLLVLNIYSTIAMLIIWILGTIWAFWLQTNFCTSKGLEYLYRAIVGVILAFTFFNVKGQHTRSAMSVYYVFHVLVNLSTPMLLMLLRPELTDSEFLMPVTLLIDVTTVLGILCLVVYYTLLHPRENTRQSDEVDGQYIEPRSANGLTRFLQP